MESEKGLKVFKIVDDGNCLFRSFAHQIYGDQSLHKIVRKKCCEYIAHHKQHFQIYLVTNIYRTMDEYLNSMREDRTWGGNFEIVALNELYQRPVEVYEQSIVPRRFVSHAFPQFD